MNLSPSLNTVLSHPAISQPALWRGNDCAPVATPSVPTGYAELDVHLPGAGWPTGVLTEIHVERPGIGELQLVMPAAARLTQAERWLVMIAPPYLPYAPALAAHGVKLSRLMLIRPKTLAEQLWACEQALQSTSCGSVMLWLDQTQERIPENALRRLQRTAERRGVLAMLFRASRAPSCAQAALRLHVSRATGNTVVRILKRRGGMLSGAAPAPVLLDLHNTLLHRPGAARHEAFEHTPATYASTLVTHYLTFPNVLSSRVALMLWLALHFRHLPLEVFTRGMPNAQADLQPIAVTSGAETGATVIAANRPAQNRGVSAGMSVSAACALASGLHTIARDSAKEQATLARIAAWSLQFTSFVSLVESGAESGEVLLEIEGSLKLFGGLGKLHQHIARSIAELGFTAHIACAPTPLAALWFARAGLAALRNVSMTLRHPAALI